MKLFRIIFEKKSFGTTRKIAYFVGRNKEDAIKIASSTTKDEYKVKSVCYLAESMNYGNTIFVKGLK